MPKLPSPARNPAPYRPRLLVLALSTCLSGMLHGVPAFAQTGAGDAPAATRTAGAGSLAELSRRNALTVRALVAFERIPTSVLAPLSGLRARGVDVLGASPEALARMLDDPGVKLDPGQRDALGKTLEIMQQVKAEAATPTSAAPQATPTPSHTAPPSSAATHAAAPAPGATPMAARAPAAPIPPLPAFSLPPALPIVELGSAQYAGMITTAKEATLSLMGPLSEADTARVEQRWAGYYSFPAADILDYFRRATPILSELLNVREAIALTSASFDQAWAEAALAAQYESEPHAEAALTQAALLKDYLVALDARARKLAEAMQALGEAPDPLAAQDAAASGHRKATDTLLGLLAPAAGPEGIWFGVEAYEEERWIEGITEFPTVFVVYAVGPPAAQRFRALMLDAGEYEEKTDPYIDVLEMHEDEGTPKPALHPYLKGGRINHSFETTEVDEDGETDSWITTLKANVLETGGTVRYPDPASIPRAETALKALLAKTAKAKEDARSAESGTMSENVARIGTTVGADLIEALARSQIEDLRRHHELTPAFVAAARQWLEERPFSADSTLAEDRAQLSARVAAIAGPAPGAKLAKAPAPTAKPAPVDESRKADEARKAAEAEAQAEAERERIDFHRHNIGFVEANLARDRAELAKETDPERRAALEFRIVGALSDIQAEKDLIASIETGTLVRTRSPFDDYAHAGFIANIRDTQQRMERFQRGTASLLKLAAMLPGEEGDNARAFVERQLTPEVRTRMDEAVIQQIADALGKKVQGHHLGQQAKDEEAAALANLGVEAAENIKQAADSGMMVASLFGGQAVDTAYQAVTGYIEGGPTEAVLRTVSSIGPRTGAAVEALRGYREGGLAEAATRGSIAFITSKGIEYGMGKVVARAGRGGVDADGPAPTAKAKVADAAPPPTTAAGDAAPAPLGPTAFEREAKAQFDRARKEGEALVQDLRAAQRRLADAGSAGRPAAELAQIQKEIRDKVTSINGNPNAKNYLKYQGDPTTQRMYVLQLESVHGDVERQFHQNMRERGWNQQALKEMRNAASAGSVGMDYDIGLDEAAMKSLTRDGKPAMLHTWQTEAQQAWEQAYAKVTGGNAKLAWESVTTSKHLESYRDTAWLGKDKSKVSKAWGQQAADVTRYKSWHMLEEAPKLSHFERLQEVSRGAAKDFDTKVAPMLDRIKPTAGSADHFKASRQHWQEVRQVLAEFGNNTIDPITANRRIRLLTGGKDIPQVVDEMATLMEAAIKFGPGG